MAAYKVVDSEQLDSDLTAIADSIRAKSGTAESLNFPAGFKSAIDSLEVSSGEVGKPYIDTSKITNFAYFCAYRRFENYSEALELMDTSNLTSSANMFQQCGDLIVAPLINTSKATTIGSMFYYCSKLKNIPFLDISSCTNFSRAFAYCEALESVSFTTAKGDFSTDSFMRCFDLQDITIGEGWAVSIYLNYSDKLTVESLHGMIENLADLTGQTAKTFKIGSTNLAKIDAEHITMLQNKNWNYS